MDVRIENRGRMLLAGFSFNTRIGFFPMGKYWKKLHETKQMIPDRADPDFLVGLNDYSSWNPETEKQPAFDYLAAAEVQSFSSIPKGMKTQELPAGNYVVFTFRAKSQDSLQPAADYIYKTWFPQSTCRLNEAARYDFAKYGEQEDENGMSVIEYWIPIL